MRRGAAALLALTLKACASAPPPPPADAFDAAWRADAANAARQSLPEYRRQVRAFYEGSLLAPGWTRAQRRLLHDLPAGERAALGPRLDALGRATAAEWAKDNAVRRIDSARLVDWSRRLQAAKEDGRLQDEVDALAAEAAAAGAFAISDSR